MTEISAEVGVAISLSNLRPFDIVKVLAGTWTDRVNGIASMFYIKMRDGLVLVTTFRDEVETTASVFKLDEERPLTLVEDGWNTNEEELNANLPQFKAEAKNGVDTGSIGQTTTRPVVRSKV